MGAVRFKGAQCQWGTQTTVSFGTVINDRLRTTDAEEPIENKDGQLVGVAIYDDLYSGSLSVVPGPGQEPPQTGDVFAVKGKRLYVKNVEDVGSHKGKRMYEVTLAGGANLTL